MKSPVEKQYNFWAIFYDRLWSGYIRRTHSKVMSRLSVRKGMRVLDLGCGTGELMARLAAAAGSELDLVGVDASDGMLRRARRKLNRSPNLRLVQAYAEELPFPAARFDVVVSASAAHYFRDPRSAFAEVRRVLEPSGRLVLLDWCRDFRRMKLLDALLRYLDPGHHRALSSAELRAVFASTRLECTALETFTSGIWGLMVADARAAET